MTTHPAIAHQIVRSSHEERLAEAERRRARARGRPASADHTVLRPSWPLRTTRR